MSIISPSILRAYFEDTYGDIREVPSSNEIRINSPFTQDTKYHMYINLEKGVYNDFKSGERGSVVRLIAETLKIPAGNVPLFLIQQYMKNDIVDNLIHESKSDVENTLVIPDGLSFFYEKKDGIIRNQAFSYLKQRGIPEESIAKLGYIYNPSSEYNKRIFVPFYENNTLVYFIARDFTGKNMIRFKNPKGIDSKKFVYNIDNMQETVFIFEGLFDALMLKEQVGTAMLSADLGAEQAKKIWNTAPNTIVFVPDNDKTGKVTLSRNIDLMIKYKPPSLHTDILVFHIEEKFKDFGESGENYIDINKCVRYNKFDISSFMEDV